MTLLFHPSIARLLLCQNLHHLLAHQVEIGSKRNQIPSLSTAEFNSHSVLLPFPVFSPLHDLAPLESERPHDKTPATRDFSGRMSPITTSALADDYFGSSHQALHASRDSDVNRSRVLQLEQQLRDSIAIEERLKRQLEDARVRAPSLLANGQIVTRRCRVKFLR